MIFNLLCQDENVTWYGHLRDTFAGKILTTFRKYFSAITDLKKIYRQKCRAAAEFMGTRETLKFKFKFKLKIKMKFKMKSFVSL